jgi:hypothetical protein
MGFRLGPLFSLLVMACSRPRPAARLESVPTAAAASSETAAPATATSPAAPAPLTVPGGADLDPSNDAVVGPPELIKDCEARLRARGVDFTVAQLPERPSRSGHACGAPQVVVYRGLAGGARITPAPLVSCGMALALATFDALLQEEAQRELGQPIVRVGQLGTYNCRNMARFELVSEHSYANAIDLAEFVQKDGRKFSVERAFGRPSTEPKTKEGVFLRALARRLYDEGVFSCVITEYFDPLHHNHIHLDLARYRVDGTR